MRGRDEATVPKRSAAAIQSACARVISSWVRATKFHHISTGSSNGTPPTRTARVAYTRGDAELVAADAEVGEVAGFDDGAIHLDGAGDQDQRVFVVGPERQRGGAGPEVEVDADVVGVAARRRRGAVEVADEDGGDRAVELDAWQLVVVLERGRAVAGGRRLGDPELDALESSPVAPGALLGVRDAAAGGHEVELARRDDLLGAERVAVERLAFEQPGDGLQADVGVRCDVETVPLVDGGGPHVVEEAPGSDGAATAARERPAHRGRRRPGSRGSR